MLFRIFQDVGRIYGIASWRLWRRSASATPLAETLSADAHAQVNINQRMNIFYFLDSLCDACQAENPQQRSYVDYVSRDLEKVVAFVVPEGRAGLPNLTSVRGVRPLCPTFPEILTTS
jgi:hypothetical protein